VEQSWVQGVLALYPQELHWRQRGRRRREGKEEEEEGGRGRSPLGAGAGSATVAYAAPLKYAFVYAICHTFCPP